MNPALDSQNALEYNIAMRNLPPRLSLLLGALCLGTAPLFVKAVMSVGPAWIGAYRCLLSCAMCSLLCLEWRHWRAAWRMPRGAWLALGAAGLCFGLDLYVWHRSVRITGAGLGTILGNTQVFYVGLFGWLWLRERLTWRYLLSVPLAFVGVHGMASGGLVQDRPADWWWGVGFGLATGLFYSLYIIALRHAEAKTPELPTSYKLCLATGCSGVVLAALGARDAGLEIPTGADWLWLAGMALLPGTIGWLLISSALTRVPVGTTGLILLLQPVCAVLGGALLFQERLAPWQWLGGLLTLGAIYLGATRQADFGARTSRPRAE